MEPVSVGVVVAALVAKALERAEDGAIDGAVQAARKAIEALRRRFSGDSEAEQAIEGVVGTPDSAKRQQALAAVLEERAAESTELRAELQAIADELEQAGVRIGDIEQVAEGDGNVQNAGIVNSQISINQGTTRSSGD